jgi:hypothetical protein
VEGQDTVGRDLAHETGFRHGRPGLAAVFGKGSPDVAGKITAPEDKEAFDAVRIGEAMDDRRGVLHFLPICRRGKGCAPSEAAVIAAGERAEVPRMIDAPCGEYGLAICHQRGVAMPLISLGCAASDDHLAVLIARKIHRGNRYLTQGVGRRASKGGDTARIGLRFLRWKRCRQCTERSEQQGGKESVGGCHSHGLSFSMRSKRMD